MIGPAWLRRLAWIAYAMLLVTATHLSPRRVQEFDVALSDKIKHFIAYTILGLLTVPAWGESVRRPAAARLGLLLAGLTLFGALDEWSQPWFGRDLECGDWVADVCGSVVGLAAGALVLRIARGRGADDSGR